MQLPENVKYVATILAKKNVTKKCIRSTTIGKLKIFYTLKYKTTLSNETRVHLEAYECSVSLEGTFDICTAVKESC